LAGRRLALGGKKTYLVTYIHHDIRRRIQATNRDGLLTRITSSASASLGTTTTTDDNKLLPECTAISTISKVWRIIKEAKLIEFGKEWDVIKSTSETWQQA
jgi:hypothetical protein